MEITRMPPMAQRRAPCPGQQFVPGGSRLPPAAANCPWREGWKAQALAAGKKGSWEQVSFLPSSFSEGPTFARKLASKRGKKIKPRTNFKNSA